MGRLSSGSGEVSGQRTMRKSGSTFHSLRWDHHMVAMAPQLLRMCDQRLLMSGVTRIASTMPSTDWYGAPQARR